MSDQRPFPPLEGDEPAERPDPSQTVGDERARQPEQQPGPPPQPGAGWPPEHSSSAGWSPPRPDPPFGHGGYAPPPWEAHHGVRPRTLRTLGGWAQGLLWANLGTFVLLGLVALLYTATVADVHAGDATLRDLEGGEAALGLVLILLVGPVYLATVVLYLVWQHHAHRQLVALRGPDSLRYTPGFGVGCWFIPFANLGLPVVAVGDLWRASTPPEAPRPDPVPALVRWWWALFVVVPAAWWVLTFFVGLLGDLADDVPPTWVTAGTALSWLVIATAAALGARVIANIGRRTDRLARAAGWQ